MEKEVWKSIPNYEGLYEVSSLGRVKSLNYNRTKQEKTLLTPVNDNGYCRVNLRKNNIAKTHKVHQLVAMVFFNHTPCGHINVVDHINGIRIDNHLENLQLITQRKNTSKDKKNKSSKYTGVSWSNGNNKWMSGIRINGKKIYLGYFTNEFEASIAYQNKLKEITL